MLSSLVAYALAVAALRPVESMRRGAEAEAAAEPGRWLPLPPARDEVARLGETLNTMLTRLESALAREQRFVSDASHELRTPLAALRNEGPGFAPELVEHALEPFTRGDPARLGPGAGLGLAIVDVIARAHGGAARGQPRRRCRRLARSRTTASAHGLLR